MNKKFAIALALMLSAFGSTQSVQARTNDDTTTDEETVPQDYSASTIEDAVGKVVYLYNYKTQKFLNRGGLWGTQAQMSYDGSAFTVVKNTNSSYSGTYLLKSVQRDGTSASSTSDGYLGFTDGVNSAHDNNIFFTDRPNKDLDVSCVALTCDSMKVAIPGVKPTRFTTLYTIKVTSKNSKSSYNNTPYYMSCNDEGNVVGVKASTITKDGLTSTEFVHNNGDLCWIIVTKAVRDESFSVTGASWQKTIPATYIINDPDFGRNDTEITSWKNAAGTAMSMTYGRVTEVPTDKTTTNYYIGNGYPADGSFDGSTKADNDSTYSSSMAIQKAMGKYMTANIFNEGKLYQEITCPRTGWYKVTANAFTTASTGGAVIYIQNGTSTSGSEYAETAVYSLTDNNVTLSSNTYVAGAIYLQSAGTPTAVEAIAYMTKGETMTIGMKQTATATSGSYWASINNIQLTYYGNPEVKLVLDEEKTSVDYINAQAKVLKKNEYVKYDGTRVLYLNRTLNAGKWNTIVLPVDLTVAQARAAFGSNVKISEFQGANNESHPGRIYFTPVEISNDTYNNTAIEAGKLYLINPENTDAYQSGNTVYPQIEDSLSYGINKYYTIVGVTFCPDADLTASVLGSTGKEYYNDDADGIQFAGTYVSNDSAIPANSYVISGKATTGSEEGLWYYRTVATKSKGFRGWLQGVTTAAKNLEIDINGVVELCSNGDTTGINDVIAGDDAVNGNVFSTSGQIVRTNATSLEGLGRGIYIVNGKKYVVK